MEVWKDIHGYNGDYRVSNFGRVMSLKCLTVKILKQSIGSGGYSVVSLHFIGRNPKTFPVHKLVAIHFLGHTPCGYRLVVDHKDNDKRNNNSDNLNVVTQRENTSKDKLNPTSKYVGVYWRDKYKVWVSSISIGGKAVHLGHYKKEKDARDRYLEELDKYNEYIRDSYSMINANEYLNKIKSESKPNPRGTKVTMDQVGIIRSQRIGGAKLKEIAEIHNLSIASISNIVNNKIHNKL